jgi:hypothetical protein
MLIEQKKMSLSKNDVKTKSIKDKWRKEQPPMVNIDHKRGDNYKNTKENIQVNNFRSSLHIYVIILTSIKK